MKKRNTLEPKDSMHNMSDNEKRFAAIERHRYNYSVMFLCICNCCSNVECNSNEEGRNGRNVWNLCYTAGKPWTESINQSIGCQIFRAKGRQPRFNAQLALHNYVNEIICDTVPQKNLLGNVEITVICVFFLYLSKVYSYRQMTDRF